MSDLRNRLIAALDPVSDWTADRAPVPSDYDLNPSVPRQDKTLRQAAVLVPIIDRSEGATVLLTRRADTLTSHSGQVAFPGGRLDPGETAVQAALREATEEVALDPGFVDPLGLLDAYETVTAFCVTPVVALVRPDFTVVASEAEVAEVFEVPLAFLMNEANHRRDHYDPPGGDRRWFWAMPYENRYIWGATAGMIRNLRRRLTDTAEVAA